MTRSVEEFHPIKEGEVSMYTCGPTVYNYAHIGNLRTFMFEDILKKAFKRDGYKVTHVMNITDVGHLVGDGDDGEDKMSVEAKKEKKTVWDIAKFYTEAFLKDEEKLNIEKADFIPRATDHIKEIIALIETLEKKGYTYTANGNVYYSIDKFPNYGCLARLDKQSLNAGERVEVDKAKKNPHDFVLWFTNSKFENQAMKWDSPFGVGYPGWHIECSAMSMKYLGDHFDIHCGGIDAIPVHHTNEIAQSEAATGKKWVNYWMHGEFLLSEKGKMSKSSGEFLTLTTLENHGIHPLSYRYFVLGCHYRKQLQFSYDALKGAESALKKLKSNIKRIKESAEGKAPNMDEIQSYNDDFDKALYNDLNTPICLAILHNIIKDDKVTDASKLEFIKNADKVLSLSLLEDEKTEEVEIPEDIKALADERLKAKANKDYALSDSLRDKILSLGYRMIDKKDGYAIEKV